MFVLVLDQPCRHIDIKEGVEEGRGDGYADAVKLFDEVWMEHVVRTSFMGKPSRWDNANQGIPMTPIASVGGVEVYMDEPEDMDDIGDIPERPETPRSV